jgi:hypothetical protein
MVLSYTYTHTHKHTYTHKHPNPQTHIYTQTPKQTYTHKHTNTQTNIYTQTHKHIYTQTHIFTHIHIQTHKCTETHTQTYTHSYLRLNSSSVGACGIASNLHSEGNGFEFLPRHWQFSLRYFVIFISPWRQIPGHSRHFKFIFSLLSSFWKKWKWLYAITMLSPLCVHPRQLLNAWTKYYDTWAHLNGILHKSLPSVCVSVCVSLLSLIGNGSVKSYRCK